MVAQTPPKTQAREACPRCGARCLASLEEGCVFCFSCGEVYVGVTRRDAVDAEVYVGVTRRDAVDAALVSQRERPLSAADVALLGYVVLHPGLGLRDFADSMAGLGRGYNVINNALSNLIVRGLVYRVYRERERAVRQARGAMESPANEIRRLAAYWPEAAAHDYLERLREREAVA